MEFPALRFKRSYLEEHKHVVMYRFSFSSDLSDSTANEQSQRFRHSISAPAFIIASYSRPIHQAAFIHSPLKPALQSHVKRSKAPSNRQRPSCWHGDDTHALSATCNSHMEPSNPGIVMEMRVDDSMCRCALTQCAVTHGFDAG